MTNNKRKKKKRRKTKLNLRSCFSSFANESERPSSYYYYSNKSNNRDFNNKQRHLAKLISVTGCNKNGFITDNDFVNNDDVNINNGDRDPSSHRRRISRLFKSVVFYSFMVKKNNSSKSPIRSDTRESSSSLSSEKTIKSVNYNKAIRVREFTDFDSSLLSSSSRTTSSSNLSSSCCSSSTSNSQWSSEQKTSSRIDLPKPNHDKVKRPKNNQNSIRWCLFLLLSLVVLMVYGRIYSILCTSTWFYFVPCPSRNVKRVNSVSHNTVKVADTDSERYKKSVIVAGLLQKTHKTE